MVGIALVALLAGCTGSAAHHSLSPSSSGPSGPSGPRDGSGSSTTNLPVSTLSWAPCAGHRDWQCAHLSVPLDHAKPSGATISIALSRHPATGTSDGPLLINPGGPGASGIDFGYQIGTIPAFASLFQHLDVIGFDPRGVGQSTPITCVDGPTLDKLNDEDPNPSTPAKQAVLIAGAKELAAACAKASPQLLPHLATVDAARDMDDIRTALGASKMTYLGFSYGTLLGATYAGLFPTHVRALALDSALDPAVDEGEMNIQQAASFEQNLDAFLNSCGSSCAFAADPSQSRVQAFMSLMATIDAAPLVVGTRHLGPGETFYGVADLLYTPQTWPDLASALQQAAQGDGSGLLAASDDYTGRHSDGTYDNSLVSNTAINCVDRQSPPTIAALQALATQAATKAPYFGPGVAWSSIACLYWPVPPETRTGPMHAPGAPPILVVGSTGDPATPYAWAKSLAQELGSGILVTRDGNGHGAYLASSCVQNIVNAYLENLIDPAPGAVCEQ
jgi:pimeloyl-ACP methyl ester carboxylesterase